MLKKARIAFTSVAVLGLFMCSTGCVSYRQPVPGADPARTLFPFVLPWDDASPGITNLAGMNEVPAGKNGFVTAGMDGHLYAGGKRIRFLGINFTNASCFPEKEDAVKIAARLAKFGINIVRFHLMDAEWGSVGIFTKPGAGSRKFNADAVDRLDFFISELKKNGIYANLNLLTGRIFTPGDGLPESVRKMEWKDHQTPAMFNPRMIALQKEYAAGLLDRVNPYTGISYTEEPALALVEICNEHGLIHGWMDGSCDRMPEEFRQELAALWNDALRKKYKNDGALKKAWVREEPEGEELIINGTFADGTKSWNLERHEKARATFLAGDEGGLKFVQVSVTQPSDVSWHVQLSQTGITVESDRLYTLKFKARADRPIGIGAILEQAHDPWNGLGFERRISLSEQWQEFQFTFSAPRGDTNARLVFRDMGKTLSTCWFADVRLSRGGSFGLFAEESVETKSVRLFTASDQTGRTRQAVLDFTGFLWDLEEKYWNGMRDYVRKDLKAKAPVIGTIVGTSTPNLMAGMDAVDSHAYWQHPRFDRSWGSPWRITNKSMTGEADGGTIGALAVKRVAGKPFTVTEYNHPTPNTFGSEAMPLLAAYAAFQDWDAIFAYTYGDGTLTWPLDGMRGYFDWDRDPGKFMGFLPAACFFRRMDIAPAGETVAAVMTREKERDLLPSAGPWRLVDGEHAGLRRETALLHKVALAVSRETLPAAFLRPDEAALPANGLFASDTGEILWDTKARFLTVNTPRSKMVLGYAAGRELDLDGIIIAPVSSLQDGWVLVTMTGMNGLPVKEPGARTLVTAVGLVMNTGMNYRIYPDSPAGFPPPQGSELTLADKGWGRGPALAEGIVCRITLPVRSAAVSVFALDGKGRRTGEVKVPDDKNRAIFELSGQYKTLWYEVEIR